MPQSSVEQAFETAVQDHVAGRLLQAGQLYREILARRPDHAGATHYLGLIAAHLGENDAAADLIRRAIAIDPRSAGARNDLGNVLKARGELNEAIAAYRSAIGCRGDYAEAHNNLGVALVQKGQLAEAVAACRRAVALKPDLVQAHHNLGNALQASRQFDEAIAAYQHAISLDPDLPEAHCNIAAALKDGGRFDEAIAECRRAIDLRPDFPEAWCNLSAALKGAGRTDDAIATCRRAIAINPEFPEAHCNLANLLCDTGQVEESVAACERAIALKSDFAEAYRNLGNALHSSGQFDRAIDAARKAISLRPDFVHGYGNLANALRADGQLDEAIAVYRHAVALDPNSPEMHRNLALALLARGDFSEGWNEYEWRWRCREFIPLTRDFTQPLWDGRPLNGTALLLHAEQGIGDAIQFIRYLPLVNPCGGRIIVECQASLRRLIEMTAGGAAVIARGESPPRFDLHCPLLSLPRIFGTTVETVRPEVPYLQADANMAERWRTKLARRPHSLNVGLAWAGSPSHANDRHRSIALAAFAPLAEAPNVQFHSLQKGEAAMELRNFPAGMSIRDWSEDLNDFADTAALIANLDLVISVDTAVAHLTGAMGKPVWVLLPFAPDWRWMLRRDDSPWYPSMRLFRQPVMGDWPAVVRQAAICLAGEWSNCR